MGTDRSAFCFAPNLTRERSKLDPLTTAAGACIAAAALGIGARGHSPLQDHLAFVPDPGQWDAQVRVAVRPDGLTTRITESGSTTRVLVVDPTATHPGFDRSDRTRTPSPPGRAVVVDLTFVGAPALGEVACQPPHAARMHHFAGPSDRHVRDVVPFGLLRFDDLYPGVSLELGARDCSAVRWRRASMDSTSRQPDG
ncbi:MAG: hypothetical protein IPM29_22920 [Planctomycetes bacterium]|nr:hypothetical protein [Planctomycetota bacterium]